MKSYRIFLVLGGRATSLDGSKIWLRNLYDPLIDLGHDVTLFDSDEFSLKNGAPVFSAKAKELLSNYLPDHFSHLCREKKFDIFFSYLHAKQIDPQVYHAIKKEGVFIVNFTTNYHQFDLYREIAKIVDYNIYISRIAKEGFDQAGARSYYMPLAANPSFYKPSARKTNEASFIGSVYGVRPYYLWRVLQNDIDLSIYGPGWLTRKDSASWLRKALRRVKAVKTAFQESGYGLDRKIVRLDEQLRLKIVQKLNVDHGKAPHAALSDEEYPRVLAESAVVINFNESRFNHDFLNHNVLLGCNLRDFEIPMSRTLSLTQYSDELSSFFEDGKEVVSFRNEFELVDKVKYYIAHKTEREQIAKAGYGRALKDHTWQKRFEDFFGELKF